MLYFTLASYIVPKKVLNSFEYERQDLIDNIKTNKRYNSQVR
jgi:hypothetical protein